MYVAMCLTVHNSYVYFLDLLPSFLKRGMLFTLAKSHTSAEILPLFHV